MKSKFAYILIFFLIAFTSVIIYGFWRIHNWERSYSSPVLKSPLTFQKYTAIINSSEIMSDIHIWYFERETGTEKNLTISGGLTSLDTYFSSIESFSVHYSRSDTTTSPPSTVVDSRINFSQQDMQELLNYISLNNEYIFNSEEYEGLTIPIESEPSINICNDNFSFAMGFFDPGNHTNVWAITKCMDERPQEGHPLYGLIQILERDFISKFEEQ
jgi:hypothetical protein